MLLGILFFFYCEAELAGPLFRADDSRVRSGCGAVTNTEQSPGVTAFISHQRKRCRKFPCRYGYFSSDTGTGNGYDAALLYVISRKRYLHGHRILQPCRKALLSGHFQFFALRSDNYTVYTAYCFQPVLTVLREKVRKLYCRSGKNDLFS